MSCQSVVKGYQSLKWRKSAYPSSESISSALNALEWNSLSSLLPLSLLFIFRLGISTFPRSLLPRCGAYTLFFFLSSEGKASRKAWCCTWKRDFWLSREPTSSERTWAHSWIFFRCSGTYGYIMKVWDLRGHEGAFGDRRAWQWSVRLFFPSLPLDRFPTCNKSHIVAMFISTPSGVWLTHNLNPDRARPLLFWIHSQASMRRPREVGWTRRCRAQLMRQTCSPLTPQREAIYIFSFF